MRYALIEDGAVTNLIEATLPVVMEFEKLGMVLSAPGNRPVQVGDTYAAASDAFFRDGVEIAPQLLENAKADAAARQADTDEMTVDHEYRITLLELGVI